VQEKHNVEKELAEAPHVNAVRWNLWNPDLEDLRTERMNETGNSLPACGSSFDSKKTHEQNDSNSIAWTLLGHQKLG